MFNHPLAQKQDNEVVANEYEVLLVHVDVAQSLDQLVYGLRRLHTQKFLLDGRVRFLYHPEFLVSRVFHNANIWLLKECVTLR
jgi:hypothetical protein